jgi:orotate phosphoribosyltransferase
MISFDRERLIALLRSDVLKTGEFALDSGKRSHYFVDRRRVALSAEGAALIGAGILEALIDLPGVRAIGGHRGDAAVITGAALAFAPAFGKPRLHGFLVDEKLGAVEGPLESGSIVALVADVATTGRSALLAADAVEALGCTVSRMIAVLDCLEGAAAALRERNIEFLPLVTLRDLGVDRTEAFHPDFDPLPPLQGP